jgi:hypothetical protein
LLKLKIDLKGNISEFLQNLTCDEDIADTLVTIIDRIIIDEYIKPSPVENSLPLSQKEELIYNKRNEILSMMSKRKIDTNYISSSQTSDLYSNI